MPPKKLKKQPKNPFYFFMMDWRKEQVSKGHEVPVPLNLLADAATPAWKDLPEDRREIYKEKARIAKGQDKTNMQNKFTSDGKSYAQVFTEEQEIIDFIAQMQKEITDTVSSISQNIKSLVSYRFYLIHANHYCYYNPKKIFIPCEVAIAEYSIEEGVIDTLHFFPTVIETPDGKLPLGYFREAKEISEKTHCVPLPPMDGAEDYQSIAARLISFLQRSGTSKLPPLYTQENNLNCNNSMSTVKDFLFNVEEFCDVRFRVYNLPELFYELRNACADASAREGIDPSASWFPTKSLAEMELDRDIFHFSRGISCPYHEDYGSQSDTENLVTQYCSLSTVQRWCFLISDYCCKDVGIQIKSGKHCPPSTHLDQLEAVVECSGSKAKNKHLYVDAPPPAVNCWSKRSAIAKEVIKPNSAANTATEADDDVGSSDDAEASAVDASKTFDDLSDTIRLPKKRGRGERLIAAINRLKLDANEEFPALGVGRGRGRF